MESALTHLSACLLFATATFFAQTAPPQQPLMAEDVFKNVQVLSGIPVNQFMETMGYVSASLGYNCTNCHGGAVVQLGKVCRRDLRKAYGLPYGAAGQHHQ